MALDSYDGLKALVLEYLRQDDLSAVIDDLIDLAEDRMDDEVRLRVQMAEVTGQTVDATGRITLPDDYLELFSFNLQRDNLWHEMEYRPPNEFYSHRFRQTFGAPRIYTINGAFLDVLPYPETDTTYPYELRYYARIARLSNGTAQQAVPTNVILDSHPRLYLFATLVEAEPYLVNDPRIATWEGKYQQSLQAAQAQDMRSRYRPGSRQRAVTTSAYEGRRTYP